MMPLVKYQTIKGTFDRLPEDAAKWNFVLDHARRVLERFGAGEIHTPIFEDTGVFTKAVGESSDIVRKEMYSLTDRGGRDMTLRPEATAPLIRAYLQHGMGSRPTPVKLWTFEPMFRGEQPQHGRGRQFHQVGFEIIGLADPIADAETIDAGFRIFESLGIKNYEIRLGSVGDPDDRLEFNAYLRDVLSPVVGRLSQESQERLKLNPMRILDSKVPVDQTILRELAVKPMLEFLGLAAREHFASVQEHLKEWGVPFVVDSSIVRGLDYYRRTAFEFIHSDPSMAGCSTILAGGRYDGLAEILGGPHTPGIGFGMGCERVLLALEAEKIVIPESERLLAYVIPLEEDLISFAHGIARTVRGVGRAQAAYKVKGVGKALADAEKFGARYAIVVGATERQARTVNVRHLETRSQESVALEDLRHWFQSRSS
jgi:histidyl-tRNA synthetase